MKKVKLTTILAAVAMIAGSTAFAGNDDWHNSDSYYKDLYALRQLHVKFHQAVSHAGINATTQAKALEELLALWTDDGVLVISGVTYGGRADRIRPAVTSAHSRCATFMRITPGGSWRVMTGSR